MAYGDGRVYLRRGKHWWIAYYGIVNGQPREVRESAGPTEEAARALLAQRLREVKAHRHGESRFLGPSAATLTVRHLVGAYLEDAEMRRLRSLRSIVAHSKALLGGLGRVKATLLTTDHVRKYVAVRRRLGRADATIDRELEVLRCALKLALRAGRLGFVPHVPAVSRPQANARTGFVSPGDFYRVLAAIDDPDFRDFLEWFWWTAMRPGEIASLRWDWLDQTTGALVLHASSAKSGRPRVIPVTAPPLSEILERRRARRRVGVPLISHADGQPCRARSRQGGVLDRWYDRWRKALAAAGLPASTLIYDLRRSAIRDLRQAGVPERTIMAISGHLTRGTFDRYSVQTVDDLQEALGRAREYVSSVRGHGQHADQSVRKPLGKP